MALKLKGSTSGFVAIDAPSVAGNNTLILPENTGSSQQLLGNDITAGVVTFTSVTVNRNGDLTVPGTISIGGTLTYEDVTNIDSIGIVTARKQLHVGTGVSIAAGGLNVTAGVSTFAADVSIADKIIHSGDSDTLIRFPTANTFTVETAANERFRITSGGDVGINRTPTQNDMPGVTPRLHVLGISTVGQFNTVARFESGTTDGNDTGAAVVINQTNDRGLVIQGGRGGDADGVHHANSGLGRFSIINNGGTFHKFMEAWGQNGQYIENISLFTGNEVERLRITSAGLVGIGTVPETDANLHVMGSGRGRAIIHAGGSESAQLWLRNPKRTWKIHNYYDQDSLIFTDDSDTRLTLNADGNVTAAGIVTATEFVATSVQTSGRKNLIINGGMSVAQRGTAAVTVTSTAKYRSVDRWKTDIDGSGGGDFSHAQSTDVPTGQGLRHSSKFTTVTQASQPTAESNHHQVYQMLEKQDIYHLEWGTSNAKTCTLSFWVKGSVTGTYGLWFSIYTASNTQYYWTNYTINSANTWEKKTITVTGPTSGGNINLAGYESNTGFRVEWVLGVGSDSETGTLNEWTTSSTFRMASGSVYLPENAGATFYLTGVQFEVGSNASAFEFRSFAEELALCQRYYEGVYMTDGTAAMPSYASYGGSTNFEYQFKVEKRATPTWSLEGNAAWTGATPNAFESKSACVFQHNAGTLFRLGDAAGDLCGSFSAEL